jgi:hypothetical protein
MFLKNGKPYFRLFYENLVNKPLLLFQECEGVEAERKNIYHIYGAEGAQKMHRPSGNLDDSRIVERENEEECLNVIYKNFQLTEKINRKEFAVFYASPLCEEPDKARVKWSDKDG